MPTAERTLTERIRVWIMDTACEKGYVQSRDACAYFKRELADRKPEFVSGIIHDLIRRKLLEPTDEENGAHGRKTYTATDLGRGVGGATVRPRKWDAKPLCVAFGLVRGPQYVEIHGRVYAVSL